MTSVQEFTELYRGVYKDLYRFALCMMRQPEDAEDAVSEAVAVAYEHRNSLRKKESFRAWIFQITANVCRRKLKEKSRTEVELSEEYTAQEEDRELQMDVKKAMEILEEEEKLIVALSAFGGYSSKEIGDLLKMNPNTVRSKRRRAIGRMSAMLGRQEVLV